MSWEDPTTSELARSIGCLSSMIVRSERHYHKSQLRTDGRDVWTSFVDTGDPERLTVYETIWPQCDSANCYCEDPKTCPYDGPV